MEDQYSYFSTTDTAVQEVEQQKATEQRFSVCTFNGNKDNQPKQKSVTWTRLCKVFSTHLEQAKKDGPAWSAVSYKAGLAIRANQNVEAISMAVLDIDTDANLEEAEGKLRGIAHIIHTTFSHTTENPKFRVVIPFQNPVPASEWGSVWKRLAIWHGLPVDPATKDPSRLYYLPSHQAGSEDYYTYVAEGQFLDVETLPPLPVAKVIPIVPPSVNQVDCDLGTKEGLKAVVKRCKFMQEVSAPKNQPGVPEPFWMSMISNASRFDDRGWIHEASKHHPDYDETETENRIDRHFAESGPITCSRIRELGFKGCPTGGCQLPSGRETAAPAGLGVWAKNVEAGKSSAGNDVPGYEVNDQGVFQIRYKDGEPYEVLISSRIDIVALTRNEQNQNWGLLLNFKDRDGHVHEWAMPHEMLTGSGDLFRQQLLNRGAVLMSGQNIKEAFAGYFMQANPPDRALCVENSGWHGSVFVLPHQTFGNSTERVILQTVDASRTLPFGRAGTLEDWKREVATKCSGNSRLVLAVCVALAGPFLEPLGQENGGFHFRGPSSSGKTKALTVAGSVWGSRRMVRTWRTTGNAIEGLALDHNDSVLILDELGQVSPDEAGEIAYTLANGQSKSRANRFGNARPTHSWRLLFLSTGEIGLADHVASAGEQIKAGQEVRMLDIPAEAGAGLGVFENIHGVASPQQFADQLQSLAETYYGTAAEALLTRLTSDAAELDRAVAKVKAFQQEFVDQNVAAAAHGQVFRAAGRFGIVAGVGEYCIEVGILPWQPGEALSGVGKCFTAWVESRGGTQASEVVRAVAQIRLFLEHHGESRFTLIEPEGIPSDDRLRTINRVGFKARVEGGAFEYWVLPEAYRAELCRGFDPKLVTRTLLELGALQMGSQGKATVTKRLPGIEVPTRVYVIKPSIFEGRQQVAA